MTFPRLQKLIPQLNPLQRHNSTFANLQRVAKVDPHVAPYGDLLDFHNFPMVTCTLTPGLQHGWDSPHRLYTGYEIKRLQSLGLARDMQRK